MANYEIHGIRKQWPSEYPIWLMMKQRCYNPKNKEFRWYGARGITVCDRWRTSFPAFIEDMGPRPDSSTRRYSIDRINNDGPYSPENCRWATTVEQRHNQRPRQAYIRKDLTNQIFGRLTALTPVPKTAYGKTRWVCRCSCGGTVTLPCDALLGGNTRSCGCLKREEARVRMTAMRARHRLAPATGPRRRKRS